MERQKHQGVPQGPQAPRPLDLLTEEAAPTTANCPNPCTTCVIKELLRPRRVLVCIFHNARVSTRPGHTSSMSRLSVGRVCTLYPLRFATLLSRHSVLDLVCLCADCGRVERGRARGEPACVRAPTERIAYSRINFEALIAYFFTVAYAPHSPHRAHTTRVCWSWRPSLPSVGTLTCETAIFAIASMISQVGQEGQCSN